MKNYKSHNQSKLIQYLIDKRNNPIKYKIDIKKDETFFYEDKSYLNPFSFEHTYLIIEMEVIKKMKNNEYQKKYREEPINKLASNLRSLILNSLKNKGFRKKSKTHKILGCEYNFFAKWLNYNKHNKGLHIDHIVPVSLAITQNEIELLNHYSNFQLLKSTENMIKGNRYIYNKNLKKVLENHPNSKLIEKIIKRSKIKILK